MEVDRVPADDVDLPHVEKLRVGYSTYSAFIFRTHYHQVRPVLVLKGRIVTLELHVPRQQPHLTPHWECEVAVILVS